MLQTLAAPNCALGEGPLWHAQTNEFVFADILNCTLYAWNADDSTGAVRTLLSCEYQLGAFLFDTKGDLVLFTEDGVFACPYGAGRDAFTLLWSVPMDKASGERFNDAITDPSGRMLAGTKKDQNEEGVLWVFEAGKEPKIILRDLQITNGMGFSPDRTVFYHTDSGKRTIYSYQYDNESASISDQKALVTLVSDDGAVPDGMTVDAKGNLWTACWGNGKICSFTSDGAPCAVIETTGHQTSSVMFGGKDFKTLLITSAGINSPSADDGSIFYCTMETPGVAEFAAVLP